uniref:DUF1263 domain-containing protein n=1 Tax=Oryza sativa subsp. japonica TaxID=39947 RepID=Q6YZI1_ORYSJ|nr:hypothetical protein [Oryza sativa Japonica Group]
MVRMKPGIYLTGTNVPSPGGNTPAPARDECLEALILTGWGEACTYKGSGRLSPRGRNGSATPRGDKEGGGHITLGPDPPKGVKPRGPPRYARAIALLKGSGRA